MRGLSARAPSHSRARGLPVLSCLQAPAQHVRGPPLPVEHTAEQGARCGQGGAYAGVHGACLTCMADGAFTHLCMRQPITWPAD